MPAWREKALSSINAKHWVLFKQGLQSEERFTWLSRTLLRDCREAVRGFQRVHQRLLMPNNDHREKVEPKLEPMAEITWNQWRSRRKKVQ
ncbi:MAG TPA: hypothetical protein VN730_02525 [Steroidobacteraceae bacterium]|nr:hypothetical protein [Steroidobacteraceae bacterium]